jgi:hypothetical protein
MDGRAAAEKRHNYKSDAFFSLTCDYEITKCIVEVFSILQVRY